jgi:hypothetical protein
MYDSPRGGTSGKCPRAVAFRTRAGGGPASVLGISLGVDAIQEFSVVTGNAPADYGKTSGGVIDAVTRAGTNQLHGSLYEFLRNERSGRA